MTNVTHCSPSALLWLGWRGIRGRLTGAYENSPTGLVIALFIYMHVYSIEWPGPHPKYTYMYTCVAGALPRLERTYIYVYICIHVWPGALPGMYDSYKLVLYRLGVDIHIYMFTNVPLCIYMCVIYIHTEVIFA